MQGHRVWAVGVAVVTTVLAGRVASGQVGCYQGAGPSMVNICTTAQADMDYRVNGTYRIAAVNVGTTSYVLDIHGNSLDVFDATAPANPTRLTLSSVGIPWWPPPDGGMDPSLVNRLRGMATLEGFPYALASFYTDGWDFFKLGTNTFLRVGYRPSIKTRYLNSAMFWDGPVGASDVYAVGQLLDATAISQGDTGVYLYKVRNASGSVNPETLNYTTMANSRYRVPLGSSTDGAYSGFTLTAGSAKYYPFVVAGTPWLLVDNGTGQAVEVNLSNPILPAPTGAIWTAATAPNLFSGAWAVDSQHALLHVASLDGTNVYTFDISNAALGPVPIATTPWHDASVSPTCTVSFVSVGGGVIAAGCGNYVGYIPIDAQGLPVPPALPVDTGLTQATFVSPTQCNPNLSLGPMLMGLAAFVTPSQQTCVARGLYSWGDVIVLGDSCLSTLPSPGFTATPNTLGALANCSATFNPPSTALIAKGFPGDTFTITDTSRGTVASGTLVLSQVSPPQQIKTWTWTAPNTWTPALSWAPPTSQAPGEYQLTMTLYDQSNTPYALTQSIFLCGNPLAGITKTPATYLTGDTVTLNAAAPASQGSPSGYDWKVVAPDSSSTPATGASYPLQLLQQGIYNAYVRVHYAHTATSDSTCNTAPFSTMPAGSAYDSCASVTLDSEPFSVGALTLTQTPPPSGGNYLLGQPITLSVPYKLGAGYTATFAWALDGTVVAQLNPTPATDTATGSSKSGTVTGTIPANYYSVAGSHTASLVSSATNGGAPVVPSPQPQAPFNVIDCQPAVMPTGLSGTVSGQAPNATVTFTWNGGGTAPVTYRVHDTLGIMTFCPSFDDPSGVTGQKSCTYTYTGSAAATLQFKVDASNACQTPAVTSTETGSVYVPGPPPPTPTPTPPPTQSANFSFTPMNPSVGQTINFYGTASGGTATGWAWTFGDGLGPIGGGGGSSNLQNPTYSYPSALTYTVTLTVTFSGGVQRSISKPVVVSAPCVATAAPVASFTFPSPTRIGVPVQFTDTSTNGPTSWAWDFGDGVPPIIGSHTSSLQNPTNTFATAGTYTVKLTATNCKGSNTTQQQVVVVSACDQTSPPTADFTYASPLRIGVAAQFTDTSTELPSQWAWDFGDGTTAKVQNPSHTFAAAGTYTVTLTATNCMGSNTTQKQVGVAPPGPESVMAVDAARVNGLNGTSWRTDIRIFNPADKVSSIWLEFLPVGQNNSTPFKAGPYPILPMATLVVNNILDFVSTNLGVNFSKTALRVTYQNDANVAPVVMVRTYTPAPTGGGTYGQFAPGIAVVPYSTPSPIWITGLRNNGTTDGFRTNYSLINLRDDPGGVGGITFTLFDSGGTPQGTATIGLAPLGYLQDSVSKLFGGRFSDIGNFALRVDVPPGSDVEAYASVMDNHTGDPILTPAVPPADSPVYLPAVAHLNGEAGTVWRTDCQLTNPDPANPHTWDVEFMPKGGSLSPVTATITLGPNQSAFTGDLIATLYGDTLPADAAVSGVARVAMNAADTSNVFPIMAARSYNLTPNGTFGQSIAPLWAASGISTDSANKHLLITGMSSEDVARTNVGFVSLSDTRGVNFSVLFYDKNGNLLNPQNAGVPIPYTFALGPNGWDQDKLENRFRNAFKANLPANLDSISAVVTVTDGGPGFMYATVIDNQTGDPNFIPAQPMP